MASHKPGYILLLVLTWLTYVTFVIFSIFADLDSRYFKTGLFKQNVWQFWQFRPNDLVPAQWAFNIWDVILLYHLIWLIYITTTFARKDGEDEYVYTVGPSIHWTFYVFYLLGIGAGIAGLFMYDRNNIIVAAVLTSVMALVFSITIIIVTTGVFRYRQVMVNNGLPNEYKLIFAFVQNGIGLMVGWLSFQGTMILAVILKSQSLVSTFPTDLSGTVALAVLLASFVAIAVLDLGILETYTRYLFTPYIAIVYGLAAVLTRKFDKNSPNSIFVATATAIASFFLLLKIILAIVNDQKRPLFAGDTKSALYDDDEEQGSNYGSIASEAGSDTSRRSDTSRNSDRSRDSDRSRKSNISDASEKSGFEREDENDYYNS